MSTALMEKPAAPVVTAEQMDLITRTVASGATPDELKLYLFDCARQGVHPLDKLVHFTKRAGKYTPVTSIDFMRIRAAETGEYAGSDDAVFASSIPDYIEAATVTVWRLVQGQRCAFTATARWAEYKPEANDFMWRKMPHTMLAKCAEALALRKGFPRQLAGLYAREEMDQAGTNGYEAPGASTPVASAADALFTRGAPSAGDSGHSSTAPAPTNADNPVRGESARSRVAPSGGETSGHLGQLIRRVDEATTKNGRLKWYLHFEDGVKASTISATLAASAQQYCERGTRVQAELKTTQWGHDVLKLFPVAVEEPDHARDQREPDESDIPFVWLLAMIAPLLGMLA